MTFKNLPDHILLEKCRSGNDKAFNILFQRYFRPLFKIASKYIADDTITEELVMDLMLWLWNKRLDLQIDGELDAYLFKAMRNKVISYLRKSVLETTPIDLYHEATIRDSRLADDELAHQELHDIYRQKLNELSPQRRRVFELSRDHNKSYPEIAKDLNLSVNTVKSHMLYTLQFFREQIKKYADVTLLIAFILLLAAIK